MSFELSWRKLKNNILNNNALDISGALHFTLTVEVTFPNRWRGREKNRLRARHQHPVISTGLTNEETTKKTWKKNGLFTETFIKHLFIKIFLMGISRRIYRLSKLFFLCFFKLFFSHEKALKEIQNPSTRNIKFKISPDL
jgi:hypothetical protein